MAQITSITPTASQTVPQSPPAGGKESLFSPHLQTAIANSQPQKETDAIDVSTPSTKAADTTEVQIGANERIPFFPQEMATAESDGTPATAHTLLTVLEKTDNARHGQSMSLAPQTEFQKNTETPDTVTLLTPAGGNNTSNQPISILAAEPQQEIRLPVPDTGRQATPASDYGSNTQLFSQLAAQPEQKGEKVSSSPGSLVLPGTENEENDGVYRLLSHGFNATDRVAVVPIRSPFSPSPPGFASPGLSASAPTAAPAAAPAAFGGGIPETGMAFAEPQDIRFAGQVWTDDLPAAQSEKPGGIIAENTLLPKLHAGHRATETPSGIPGNNPSALPTLGITPKDETLLVRLSEIISNSSETRGVSVTGSAGTTVPTAIFSGPGLPVPEVLPGAAEKGAKSTPDRSDRQSHPLRHNVQQQYYQAKIQSDANGENSADKQNTEHSNSGGNTSSPQTVAPADTNSSVTAADPASSLTQTATPLHEAAGQTTSDPSRQITLPSGTHVSEDHVVQQFMERFHIARRLAESKINIKLHPAELGELKIDLSVKEGSIKATVVTQNQQVQEIIERNIAKLRTMLEGQGYSLDSVTVTSESESVGDFDLFDRQLFSQNDFTPQRAQRSVQTEAVFKPESIHSAEKDQSNGVNVRV